MIPKKLESSIELPLIFVSECNILGNGNKLYQQNEYLDKFLCLQDCRWDNKEMVHTVEVSIQFKSCQTLLEH